MEFLSLIGKILSLRLWDGSAANMDTMYMWVFKDRPDDAIRKMQLRSYMNRLSLQTGASVGFVRCD